MRRLALMAALSLTACANPMPTGDTIPADLLRPVPVVCAEGATVAALGTCAIALRQGLDTANDKIRSIAEIVTHD